MSVVDETKLAVEDAVAMAAIGLIAAEGNAHEAIQIIRATPGEDPHDVQYHVMRGIHKADEALRERGIIE